MIMTRATKESCIARFGLHFLRPIASLPYKGTKYSHTVLLCEEVAMESKADNLESRVQEFLVWAERPQGKREEESFPEPFPIDLSTLQLVSRQKEVGHGM